LGSCNELVAIGMLEVLVLEEEEVLLLLLELAEVEAVG
jgi:hypothetical protein